MNKKMKKILLLLVIILPLLGSCKKEILPSTTEVTPAMARDTLYFLMKQWYYWYNLMPTVNRESYPDPYKLLDAMMYKQLDRWSFVVDFNEYNAEAKGSFVGHGIRIGLDQTNQARIVMIYDKSPLYAEGVRRGWIVKKVNNTDVAAVLISRDATAYSNMFGPSSTTVTNTFLFRKPDGTEVTISSTKASFTINTVILYDTLHIKSTVTNTNVITGHLVLDSFIQPTEAELAKAFTFFSSTGVKDIILDLRYNTGGLLYVAQELASYIGGNSITGSAFATLQFNDKNQTSNQTFKFLTSSYGMSNPRLVVITSRLTASASECVMNGLFPFLNVVSVGDTTNGKPVGMVGYPCAQKYYFFPIMFKVINSLNQGDYFTGFAPNKVAQDDITHDFNDRQETCLNEAIHYIASGNFTQKGSAGFKRLIQFSEKPKMINGTFVLAK